MAPEEISDFLDRGRTMILASHGSDGSIHLAPMWYAMVEGRPAMWTYRRTQKALNIRGNPSVSLLVEDGRDYGSLRGVQLVGRAEIVDDPAEVLRVGTLIQQRYLEPGADELVDLRRQARKRVALLVTVHRTASWDHRKLGGTY